MKTVSYVISALELDVRCVLYDVIYCAFKLSNNMHVSALCTVMNLTFAVTEFMDINLRTLWQSMVYLVVCRLSRMSDDKTLPELRLEPGTLP